MSELGRVLGKAINEQDNIKQNQVKRGSISTWFQLNYYKIKVRVTNVLVEIQDVGGKAFIVGHPVLSVIPATVGSGTYSWTTHQNITSPNNNGRITNVGRLQMVKWLANESPPQPKYVGWGDSSTAYKVNQTDLQSPILREPDAGTGTLTGTGTGDVSVQLDASSTTGSLREIAIFDDVSAGNMWFRQVINTLSVSSTLSMKFTFTFSVTDVSENSTTILTNHGLNYIVGFILNNNTVFTGCGISNGTLTPDVTDVNLDGDTITKKTITARTKKNYMVELVTEFGTTEYVDKIMGKAGYFED